MVCTITNHDDLGQYGDLIVERRRGRDGCVELMDARRRSSRRSHCVSLAVVFHTGGNG